MSAADVRGFSLRLRRSIVVAVKARSMATSPDLLNHALGNCSVRRGVLNLPSKYNDSARQLAEGRIAVNDTANWGSPSRHRANRTPTKADAKLVIYLAGAWQAWYDFVSMGPTRISHTSRTLNSVFLSTALFPFPYTHPLSPKSCLSARWSSPMCW